MVKRGNQKVIRKNIQGTRPVPQLDIDYIDAMKTSAFVEDKLDKVIILDKPELVRN